VDIEQQIINIKRPKEKLLETLEKEYSAIAQNFGYTPVQS
jgi:hypothetical protein